MKFVKYNNFWYQYDYRTPTVSARLIGVDGAVLDEVDISAKAIVEASGFEELYWVGTSVYDNSIRSGWLDQNGIFFGCKKHKLQARFVHHMTEAEMEANGFIRISIDSYKGYGFRKELKVFFAGDLDKIAPSLAQIRYIEENYYEQNVEDIIISLRYKRVEHLHRIEDPGNKFSSNVQSSIYDQDTPQL